MFKNFRRPRATIQEFKHQQRETGGDSAVDLTDSGGGGGKNEMDLLKAIGKGE